MEFYFPDKFWPEKFSTFSIGILSWSRRHQNSSRIPVVIPLKKAVGFTYLLMFPDLTFVLCSVKMTLEYYLTFLSWGFIYRLQSNIWSNWRIRWIKYLCFYVDFLSSMDFSANSANFSLPWLTTLSIFSSFSRNTGKITVLENKIKIMYIIFKIRIHDPLSKLRKVLYFSC